MERLIRTCLVFALLATAAPKSDAAVRLKDVAVVRDRAEVQLHGIGLVVGLDGTGDGKNTQFTIRMLSNMMKRKGLELPTGSIKVKNVAAVMVTATVSPYTKPGGSFDVTVSSMGDASSLEGGTLLFTILTDPGGNGVAYAQGPLSVGGSNRDFSGQGTIVGNKQLAGIVPGGGILERDLPTLDTTERNIMVTLRSPDYTTAYRLASAINTSFREDIAQARDAGSIVVNVPPDYSDGGDLVKFISDMELVTFVPDEKARVVINERTGTIIAGGRVSLAPVAIMHGTLSLTIEDSADTNADPAAAQPQQAQAGQAPQGMPPAGDRMVSFDEKANVGDVAKALNLLGVTPRDLIAIFQALKQSGSLRAELIII